MDYTISPFRIGQETEISKLIRKVYDEYIASDYSDKGNSLFYDWIAPKSIADRQQYQTCLFVASTNTQIIGLIEIRDNNHISLLFVDKDHQRRGVAKLLLKRAINECLLRNDLLDRLSVHASPFSIPVYKKLGFSETGVLREEHGILYLPMEKKLS